MKTQEVKRKEKRYELTEEEKKRSKVRPWKKIISRNSNFTN